MSGIGRGKELECCNFEPKRAGFQSQLILSQFAQVVRFSGQLAVCRIACACGLAEALTYSFEMANRTRRGIDKDDFGVEFGRKLNIETGIFAQPTADNR